MSDVIRYRPATAGEWDHRHRRLHDLAIFEHRHAVRSEVHGHPREGLGLVRLSWAVWRWTYLGGFVLQVGISSVFVLLAVAWLIGAWYFALSVPLAR